jgi:hypothetical protein
MSTNDISDDVLKLLDSGRISWPSNLNDRNKFLIEHFSNIWDALLEINIDANIKLLNEQSDDVSTSNRAWHALGDVLMLVILLEDALSIDITCLSKFDKPTDFSTYKAKIRSRVRS